MKRLGLRNAVHKSQLLAKYWFLQKKIIQKNLAKSGVEHLNQYLHISFGMNIAKKERCTRSSLFLTISFFSSPFSTPIYLN